MEKISCIYCIENIVNNKKYIGQTTDYFSRTRSHKSSLRNGKSGENRHLQSAWNKYGESCFVFYILEKCEIRNLDNLEIYYINKFDSSNQKIGYNISGGGSNNKSTSIETRELLSRRSKGIPKSAEHIRKIGESNKGRTFSEETIRKMSKPRPNILGELNPNFGKTWSKKNKKKMSLYRSGMKYSNSKTIYRGIAQEKVKNKKGKIYVYWRTRMTVKGRLKSIGNFKTEIDAAKAHDKYIVKNNLKNPLNFPEDYPERKEI